MKHEDIEWDLDSGENFAVPRSADAPADDNKLSVLSSTDKQHLSVMIDGSKECDLQELKRVAAVIGKALELYNTDAEINIVENGAVPEILISQNKPEPGKFFFNADKGLELLDKLQNPGYLDYVLEETRRPSSPDRMRGA